MLKLADAERPRAFCVSHRVTDQLGAGGTKRGFWDWRTALGPEGLIVSPATSYEVIQRLANETLPNLPTEVACYELDPPANKRPPSVSDDDLRFWLRAFLSCRPVVLEGDAEQLLAAFGAVWHALAPAPFLRPYLSVGYRIEGAYTTRFAFSTVSTGQLGKRAVRTAADLGEVSPGVKSLVKRLLSGVGFQSGLQEFSVGLLKTGMLSASESRGRSLREQSADLALALRLKTEIIESKPFSYLVETAAQDAPCHWAAHLTNWPHVRTAAANAFWARRPEPGADHLPRAQWAKIVTEARGMYDLRLGPLSADRDELRWLDWVAVGLQQKRQRLGDLEHRNLISPFPLDRVRPNWSLPEAECLLDEQPATALWLTDFLVTRVDWLANGRPEVASGSARRGLGEVVMLASKFWPIATRTPRVQSALFGLSLWALENREPELRFDRPVRSQYAILLPDSDHAQLLRAWEELSVEGMEGSPLLSTLSAVLKRSGASQLATGRFVARIEALAQKGADEAQIAQLVQFADSMGVELPCKSAPSARHPIAALSRKETLTTPWQIEDALKLSMPTAYRRALALQMFRHWPVNATQAEHARPTKWLQFLRSLASPDLYLLLAGETGGSPDGFTLNQIVESGHPNAAVLSIMLQHALGDSDGLQPQRSPALLPLLLIASAALPGPAPGARSLAEWVGPVSRGGLETALNIGQRSIDAADAGRSLASCWQIRQACQGHGIACADIKLNALPRPRTERAVPALWVALITDEERAAYERAKADERRTGVAAIVNPLADAAKSINEFAGRTRHLLEPAALIEAREAFREFVHLTSFVPRSRDLRRLRDFSAEVTDDNVLSLPNVELSGDWRSAVCESSARFLMQGLPAGKVSGAATALVPPGKADAVAWASALTRMIAFVTREPQRDDAFRNARELLDFVILPRLRQTFGAEYSTDQARKIYLDATTPLAKIASAFLIGELRKSQELLQLKAELRRSISIAIANKNPSRGWTL